MDPTTLECRPCSVVLKRLAPVTIYRWKGKKKIRRNRWKNGLANKPSKVRRKSRAKLTTVETTPEVVAPAAPLQVPLADDLQVTDSADVANDNQIEEQKTIVSDLNQTSQPIEATEDTQFWKYKRKRSRSTSSDDSSKKHLPTELGEDTCAKEFKVETLELPDLPPVEPTIEETIVSDLEINEDKASLIMDSCDESCDVDAGVGGITISHEPQEPQEQQVDQPPEDPSSNIPETSSTPELSDEENDDNDDNESEGDHVDRLTDLCLMIEPSVLVTKLEDVVDALEDNRTFPDAKHLSDNHLAIIRSFRQLDDVSEETYSLPRSSDDEHSPYVSDDGESNSDSISESISESRSESNSSDGEMDVESNSEDDELLKNHYPRNRTRFRRRILSDASAGSGDTSGTEHSVNIPQGPVDPTTSANEAQGADSTSTSNGLPPPYESSDASGVVCLDTGSEAKDLPTVDKQTSSPKSKGAKLPKKNRSFKPKKKAIAPKSTSLACTLCSQLFDDHAQLSEHLFKHTGREHQQAYKAARAQGNDEAGQADVVDSDGDDCTVIERVGNPQLGVAMMNGTSLGKAQEAVALPVPICSCHTDDLEPTDHTVQIEMVLYCADCQVLFRRNTCLEIHYRTNANCNKNRGKNRSPRLFCSTCRIILNNLSDMRKHLEEHVTLNRNGTVTFVCNICRFVFYGVGTLFCTHWFNHEKDPMFVASRYSFPKLCVSNRGKNPIGKRPDEHYFFVSEYVCRECKQHFSSENDLAKHDNKACQEEIAKQASLSQSVKATVVARPMKSGRSVLKITQVPQAQQVPHVPRVAQAPQVAQVAQAPQVSIQTVVQPPTRQPMSIPPTLPPQAAPQPAKTPKKINWTILKGPRPVLSPGQPKLAAQGVGAKPRAPVPAGVRMIEARPAVYVGPRPAGPRPPGPRLAGPRPPGPRPPGQLAPRPGQPASTPSQPTSAPRPLNPVDDISTSYVKTWICDICNKVFPSRRSLIEKHAISHFDAAIALEKFSSLNNVKRSFACTICREEYVSVETLTKHWLKHELMRYACSACADTYYTFQAYIRHVIVLCRKHNPQCRVSFGTKEICKLCELAFKSLEDLTRHNVEYHGANRIVGSRPSTAPPSKVRPANALPIGDDESVPETVTAETSDSHVCELCALAFRSLPDLTKHDVDFHASDNTPESKTEAAESAKAQATPQEPMNNSNELEPSAKATGPSFCRLCEIAFAGVKDLARHNNDCHTVHPPVVPPPRPIRHILPRPAVQDTNAICRLCTLAFKSMNALTKHNIDHHAANRIIGIRADAMTPANAPSGDQLPPQKTKSSPRPMVSIPSGLVLCVPQTDQASVQQSDIPVILNVQLPDVQADVEETLRPASPARIRALEDPTVQVVVSETNGSNSTLSASLVTTPSAMKILGKRSSDSSRFPLQVEEPASDAQVADNTPVVDDIIPDAVLNALIDGGALGDVTSMNVNELNPNDGVPQEILSTDANIAIDLPEEAITNSSDDIEIIEILEMSLKSSETPAQVREETVIKAAESCVDKPALEAEKPDNVDETSDSSAEHVFVKNPLSKPQGFLRVKNLSELQDENSNREGGNKGSTLTEHLMAHLKSGKSPPKQAQLSMTNGGHSENSGLAVAPHIPGRRNLPNIPHRSSTERRATPLSFRQENITSKPMNRVTPIPTANSSSINANAGYNMPQNPPPYYPTMNAERLPNPMSRAQNGPNTYVCPICPSSYFSAVQDFLMHLRSHSNLPANIQSTINTLIKNKTQQALPSQNKYKCLVCSSFETDSPVEFQKHFSTHSQYPGHCITQNQGSPYSPQVNSPMYPQQYQFLPNHQASNVNSVGLPNVVVMNPNLYTCRLCSNYQFSSYQDLEAHVQAAHSSIVGLAERCVCHLCPHLNVFANEQLLNEHVVAQHAFVYSI